MQYHWCSRRGKRTRSSGAASHPGHHITLVLFLSCCCFSLEHRRVCLILAATAASLPPHAWCSHAPPSDSMQRPSTTMRRRRIVGALTSAACLWFFQAVVPAADALLCSPVHYFGCDIYGFCPECEPCTRHADCRNSCNSCVVVAAAAPASLPRRSSRVLSCAHASLSTVTAVLTLELMLMLMLLCCGCCGCTATRVSGTPHRPHRIELHRVRTAQVRVLLPQRGLLPELRGVSARRDRACAGRRGEREPDRVHRIHFFQDV